MAMANAKPDPIPPPRFDAKIARRRRPRAARGADAAARIHQRRVRHPAPRPRDLPRSGARARRGLLVAVNGDASVRRLGKGDDRPINPLDDRAAVVAALASVDLVMPFDDDTPRDLILACPPDVLVKGGDSRRGDRRRRRGDRARRAIRRDSVRVRTVDLGAAHEAARLTNASNSTTLGDKPVPKKPASSPECLICQKKARRTQDNTWRSGLLQRRLTSRRAKLKRGEAQPPESQYSTIQRGASEDTKAKLQYRLTRAPRTLRREAAAGATKQSGRAAILGTVIICGSG